MKDDCDINLIVKRHATTGSVSHFARSEPMHGDFSNSVDLKSAMDAVNDANARFQELPADVRRAAGNNPTQLLEMLESDEGQRELQAAGLPIRAPQGHEDESKKDSQADGPEETKKADTPEATA